MTIKLDCLRLKRCSGTGYKITDKEPIKITRYVK